MTQEVIFEIIAFSCLMFSAFTAITVFIVLGLRDMFGDISANKQKKKSKESLLDSLPYKVDNLDSRFVDLYDKFCCLTDEINKIKRKRSK